VRSAALALLVLITGCGEGESPLAGVYRALKMVGGATAVGVTYPRYIELVQVVSGEILMAKQRLRTAKDRDAYEHYVRALATHKDACDMWSRKMDPKYASIVPEGKILVTGKLEDIASRHGLTLEKGSGTLSQLEYVSEDALQLLWAEAEKQVAVGDSLTLGLARR
jgi:hypothetical protein